MAEQNFTRDEFGRCMKDGGGPKSSSYNNHKSHPHQADRGDRREENGDSCYGPASNVRENDRILHPGLVIKGEVTRIESYGAFVSFQDRLKHNHRGLLHISQLADHRVESVTDVLKMNQKVQPVILDVEYDQRIGQRIRLSLKDVDQGTGVYSGLDLRYGSHNDNRRGIKRGRCATSPHQLQIRAKLRRETLLTLNRHWSDAKHSTLSIGNGERRENDHVNDKRIPFLRKLWSSSPSPPNKKDSKLPMKKKEYRSEENSVDESSSSDDDSTDSSSVISSSFSSDSDDSTDGGRRGWRRRRRRGQGRNSKGKRKYKSKRNKRTISSDSSRSNSSSNSSTSSNSSSSTKRSVKRDEKSKLEEDFDIDNQERTTIENLQESDLKEAQAFRQAIQGKLDNNEDDEEEGPIPLQQIGPSGGVGTGADGKASYGGALLPGEGQALAQYVQQNLRIPRRGEIGFSSDDINLWEDSGFVMSGSRHTRMNAVRIRKENQVYSAEEQKALALLTLEENQQKEAQLMQDFQTMLKEKKENAQLKQTTS